MRVNIAYAGAAAEILNDVLDTLFGKPAVRILKPDKQRRIVIGPAAEIAPEIFSTDFRQVKTTLFATLADYGGFTGNKVDTAAVQGHDLGHPETGGVQELRQSQITREQAGILRALTFNRRKWLADNLIIFNLLHGAGGVLGNHSFVVEPAEKCGDGLPHIFEGPVADLTPVFVERQVEPEIIRRDLEQFLVEE